MLSAGEDGRIDPLHESEVVAVVHDLGDRPSRERQRAFPAPPSRSERRSGVSPDHRVSSKASVAPRVSARSRRRGCERDVATRLAAELVRLSPSTRTPTSYSSAGCAPGATRRGAARERRPVRSLPPRVGRRSELRAARLRGGSEPSDETRVSDSASVLSGSLDAAPALAAQIDNPVLEYLIGVRSSPRTRSDRRLCGSRPAMPVTSRSAAHRPLDRRRPAVRDPRRRDGGPRGPSRSHQIPSR